MKYAVIGTGAIGGYYGARLAHAGMDVHFLIHRDFNYVASRGLKVNSPEGSFLLAPINAYRDTKEMPRCDVVLVCLKSVNNYLLPTLLPPILKANTLVILMQNGLGLEQDVCQMFSAADSETSGHSASSNEGNKKKPFLQTKSFLEPTRRNRQSEFSGAPVNISLAAGLAFICSAKTEPGVINHQCYGSLNIGNYSCPDPALIARVVNDFRSAGIEAHEVEYHEARWKKAVWNMPFNGMTVALNTRTDLLLKNPATRALIRAQMVEVIRAAQANGVKNIDESFADKMIQTTDAMTPYSPSMKLDYDHHRPMEIEYIYSRPLEMARRAHCPMPKLEMLEAELLFLQQRHQQK